MEERNRDNKKEAKTKVLLWFTFAYFLFFIGKTIIEKNYEFFVYGIAMLAVMIAIYFYRHELNLSLTALVFLSLLALIHFLAGDIYINNVRLYDYWLIDNVFKTDNLVHLFGGFTAALVSKDILKKILPEKTNKMVFFLVLIVFVSGLGAIYELVEYLAVIYFDAAEKVGDYFNNMKDLVMNLIGSLILGLYMLLKKNS